MTDDGGITGEEVREQVEDARQALKVLIGNFEGLATNMRALGDKMGGLISRIRELESRVSSLEYGMDGSDVERMPDG